MLVEGGDLTKDKNKDREDYKIDKYKRNDKKIGTREEEEPERRD